VDDLRNMGARQCRKKAEDIQEGAGIVREAEEGEDILMHCN
jgi:hypothetical protein